MQSKIKPRNLSGFMELLPKDQILMNKIRAIIQEVYENFGFVPLDTPVLEYSDVLLAKAGGETEKQIYSFKKGDRDVSMRFDLTVPLAKYVAMHFNDLKFPFRRYQIGKVYRGEKAQKGRFREFYQCDIDIIGNGKLDIVYDAEIPSVIYNVFKKLGLEEFTIRINNRKILVGFFEYLELSDKLAAILRVIDKIMKIGVDNVRDELFDLGVTKKAWEHIEKFIQTKGSNAEIIESLQKMKVDNDIFKAGVEEIEQVVEGAYKLGIPEQNLKIDFSIIRGLDYYTGTIYETVLDAYPEIGSICSGGRYDDLATHFTDKKLPGVGISIGLTRLFDQFLSRGFVQSETASVAKVLVAPMSGTDFEVAMEFATLLREEGVSVEVSFEDRRFKHKMEYANKMNISLVAIVGEEESKVGCVTMKDMNSGEQKMMKLEKALKYVEDYLDGLEETPVVKRM